MLSHDYRIVVCFQMDILGPGLITQQKQEITDVLDGKSTKTKMVIAIRPVSVLPNVIELSYYSNTLLLYYLLESVVGKNFLHIFCHSNLLNEHSYLQ